MAIELISTIVPKNGQDFAIALANDIRGGLHSVSTINERNAISQDRLAEGMLCYVQEGGMFQYTNGSWNAFTQSSHVTNTYEEMLQLDTANTPLGSICYVIEEEGIYYLSISGWSEFNTQGQSEELVYYHVGSTPPVNTELIWIDTSHEELDSKFDSVILDEFRAIFTEMKESIIALKSEVTTSSNTIKNLVESNTSLKKTIIELQGEIFDLESRIRDLELNGGGNGGGNTGGGNDDTGNVLSILTEDGSPLLCEDGTYLLRDA